LPDSTLEVVKRVKDILRSKGMTGADGRDDFLSERSSLANVFERFLHVLGKELVHETKREGYHGNDGGHGECEFPLPDESEDETGEESGQETGGQWDLFGNPLLDEI
jgi:hypothetical protein